MVAQFDTNRQPPNVELTYEQLKAENEQLKREIGMANAQLRFIFDTLAAPSTVMIESDKIVNIVLDDELRSKAPNAQGEYQISWSKAYQRSGLGYSTFQKHANVLINRLQLFKSRPERRQHANGRISEDLYLEPQPLRTYPKFYPEIYPSTRGGKQTPKPKQPECPYCHSTNVDVEHVTICHTCHEISHEEVYASSEPIFTPPAEENTVEADPQPVVYLMNGNIDSIGRLSDERLDDPGPDPIVNTGGLEVESMEPPEELRTLRQWVVWRYEQEEEGKKPKKVPYQAKRGRAILKADTTNPTTWATYEQARKMYEEAIRFDMKERFDGIGFVFNHDYTGVDYDHCIHDGQIDEEALVRIMELFTYSEVSPSCTGVHAIAKGTIPAACKRPDIEMYCEKRFFTWTGQRIVLTPPTIEARQEQITALYEEIAPAHQVITNEQGASPTCVYDVASTDERDAGQLEQSGELALKKANGAANNAKFAQLWSGEIAGYGSQSEADLALCRMLAYWTDNDAVLMDHLFRKSKLYRSKWDRSVGRSETYGQRTIGRAIQGLQEKVSA